MDTINTLADTATSLFAVVASLAILVTGFWVGRRWFKKLGDGGCPSDPDDPDIFGVIEYKDGTTGAGDGPKSFFDEMEREGHKVTRGK
jgi:hypothetical protein